MEQPKTHYRKCGFNAGVCWGAPLDDKEKNVKRAISCIKAGHGRVMEYVDIELVIEDVSARCLRELYTHIGGAPTRLQASTRYISEQSGFDYYTPPKIENNMDIARPCDTVFTACKTGSVHYFKPCAIVKR